MLDLGRGFSNLTRNFAPHTGQSYAMNLTSKRLTFTQRRFELYNHDNDVVMLAGGDGPNLPFPDAGFDCVALPRVLEWVAFGGRPDHHSNLIYGSLLRRFVANVYSIVSSKQPHRTNIYSVAGYRRFFKAVGFDIQQFFRLFSGYNHLAEIRPFRTRKAIWQVDPGENPRSFKYALKSSKFSFRLTALSLRIASHRPHRAQGKGVLFGNLDGQAIAVKIPFSDNSARAEAMQSPIERD
ncbi:MAG: class I SAM-dependent methyltransferase [Pseudomonadota bacterium]|nr:class I SAM-dependent methyltransferase [Pseudomonadota bacterium]